MYRQLGLWPLACVANGKKPLVEFAEAGQMTDEQITQQWIKEPAANVAIRTGRNQNLFVIDLDTDEEKAADGWSVFGQLCAEFGEVPPTPMQITGGGGRQLFFKWPPALDHIPTRAAIRFRGDRLIGFGGAETDSAGLSPSVDDQGSRSRLVERGDPSGRLLRDP